MGDSSVLGMTFFAQSPPLGRRRSRRSAEAVGVLTEARSAVVAVHVAEARKLAAAVAWAGLHVVEDPDSAATWGDTPITLGAEGVPLIAAGCVAEFAAAIGTSTNGGRAYLADALELAHRLPAVYGLIQAGNLPAWKGRASFRPRRPSSSSTPRSRPRCPSTPKKPLTPCPRHGS